MKKVKILTQERGQVVEFEKKIQDFINEQDENGKYLYNVHDIKYSITYDEGYDDYTYSVLIIYDD